MKKISQWVTALTLVGFLSFGWQTNTHHHADARTHSDCVVCHVTGETATLGNTSPTISALTPLQTQNSFLSLPTSASVVFDLTGRSPPELN